MSINKRVVELIDKTSTSKSAFSSATGISAVILSHISSGRNKVSLTAVQQILKAFPNVNADWLIHGKGQMLKEGIENETLVELTTALEQLEAEYIKMTKSIESKIDALKRILGTQNED